MDHQLRVLYETDNPLLADDFVRRVRRIANCDLYYRRDVALDGTTAYFAILGPSHLYPDFYEPPDFNAAPDPSDSENLSDTSVNRIALCQDCSGLGDSGDGYCFSCNGDGFLVDD